jgi:hypothetical protein
MSRRWADDASGGVLPNVVRRRVWSINLNNAQAMARNGPQRQGKLIRNALNMWSIWFETSARLSLYAKAQYAILLYTAHYLRCVHTYDVSRNGCIPVLVDWLSQTTEWQTYNLLLIFKPQLRAYVKHVSYIHRIRPPTTRVYGHHLGVTINNV